MEMKELASVYQMGTIKPSHAHTMTIRFLGTVHISSLTCEYLYVKGALIFF